MDNSKLLVGAPRKCTDLSERSQSSRTVPASPLVVGPPISHTRPSGDKESSFGVFVGHLKEVAMWGCSIFFLFLLSPWRNRAHCSRGCSPYRSSRGSRVAAGLVLCCWCRCAEVCGDGSGVWPSQHWERFFFDGLQILPGPSQGRRAQSACYEIHLQIIYNWGGGVHLKVLIFLPVAGFLNHREEENEDYH